MQISIPFRLRELLSSMICPQHVKTNQNTGLIRLLACLFMLIDHAGKMLFPRVPEMRLIGRLAFPLFAYGIAVGVVYTRNPVSYLKRIVLLARGLTRIVAEEFQFQLQCQQCNVAVVTDSEIMKKFNFLVDCKIKLDT